jgi:hypothetical protein
MQINYACRSTTPPLGGWGAELLAFFFTKINIYLLIGKGANIVVVTKSCCFVDKWSG